MKQTGAASDGQMNVLIFPAGTEIGLEIAHALKSCRGINLFGAGQDMPNHGRFIHAAYHVLPSVHEEGWLPALIALVNALKIDYVFPAHDDVGLALSRVTDRLPAALIASPLHACEVTRSKSATYRALEGLVRTPRLYPSAAAIDTFPILVKPDRGQGSQGVKIVREAEALRFATQDICEPIFCEYLPGEEFTIDCFSDRDRGLLFAGARRRSRTRNGIAVNSSTVSLPGVQPMAEIIGRTFQLRGAWFFQVKRASDGELALLEVAPRIAGSMAVHRVLGVNFPLLSIFEHQRLPLELLLNAGNVEMDRALSNRYRHELSFGTVYLDLDDTLILNEQVNLQVVKFVYQCINHGKTIKLLTRHRGDLEATLRRYRLQGLFDEVIHVPVSGEKASFIMESDAIFVDDSFAERSRVAKACHIPTFDGSMLEMLVEQAEEPNGGMHEECR